MPRTRGKTDTISDVFAAINEALAELSEEYERYDTTAWSLHGKDLRTAQGKLIEAARKVATSAGKIEGFIQGRFKLRADNDRADRKRDYQWQHALRSMNSTVHRRRHHG